MWHTCAIANNDTITCWGTNYSHVQADAPQGAYKSVAAGWQHTCAIANNDTITCWGLNYSYVADAPQGAYKSVTVGRGLNCAIAIDDRITCWGPVPVPEAVRWLTDGQ